MNRLRWKAYGCVAACLACVMPALVADSLAGARADLEAGKADAAAVALNAALRNEAKNAEAENLLCRVLYATEHFDQAADHCQKAVSLDPQHASYHHWLGRAIGERASRASFLSAYGLAKKTRAEFEQAVKLDPKDAAALADLGEFYTDAPGVVGGGVDKANAIAQQLDGVDASRAHQLRAQIAEKNNDMGAAEREFKAACTGPRAGIQWMELASFYRRQSRWSDMEAAVKSGVTAARGMQGAEAFYEGAGVLARAGRNNDEAIKLYEQYLASPNKSEDAPAFDALTRMAKLRKKAGDEAGAKRDQAAALALAHDYKPAQEALQDKH
ncbi:MAG TPA: tetratricopeptide repeat protein [Acidobacteriaceae bacterium]|nr:tetratricopeptide repeat protein [Acidobacteriaceae bacterium]